MSLRSEQLSKISPKVIKKEKPDAIVLQTGSIEITNINVKNALMDSDKSIEEYKQEWTKKVKEDSTNLFNIAKKALDIKSDMEVVIVKRLPRYDPKSEDPFHIKQSMSEYANSVYDQLWFEHGGPKNIHIVALEKIECVGFLRDILYGKKNDVGYDGLHLRGPAGSRHFTYRAVNAISAVLFAKQSFSPYANTKQFKRIQQSRKSDNQKMTGQVITIIILSPSTTGVVSQGQAVTG